MMCSDVGLQCNFKFLHILVTQTPQPTLKFREVPCSFLAHFAAIRLLDVISNSTQDINFVIYISSGRLAIV